jgi:hypothetical protein
VERLLLLWDELDELMGYGRHLAVGLTHAVTGRGRAATPPARASGRAATAETAIYRALNPLN